MSDRPTIVAGDSSLHISNIQHTFDVRIEYVGTRAGRGEQWEYTILADGKTVHVQADLFSPNHELDEGKVMYALTGFMAAAIEEKGYGAAEADSTLFDPRVTDLLVYWQDEITMVHEDLAIKYGDITVTLDAHDREV